MTFPLGYPQAAGPPVLLKALRPLVRWTQAGPQPPVPLNGIFWATAKQAPLLVAGNLAVPAPPNTPAPPPEAPLTVAMVPGLAAGVSNASR